MFPKPNQEFTAVPEEEEEEENLFVLSMNHRKRLESGSVWKPSVILFVFLFLHLGRFLPISVRFSSYFSLFSYFPISSFPLYHLFFLFLISYSSLFPTILAGLPSLCYLLIVFSICHLLLPLWDTTTGVCILLDTYCCLKLLYTPVLKIIIHNSVINIFSPLLAGGFRASIINISSHDQTIVMSGQ